jgi:electron transfer flavoprotein beta subunit
MRPLNIVVCIKPVPDSRYWDRLALDPVTKNLRREGIPTIIDPLGKNAIEAALQIKEARGGGKVTVITMGPPNATEILASAYALGVDECVLLTDRAFGGADTLATAYSIATGIKKIGNYDLILLGNESLDGSSGQVGPQVAEFLGIPHATYVDKMDWVSEDTLRLRQKIEMGYMVIEAKLPIAVAITKDLNEARVTPVMGAVWATEKTTKSYSATDVNADATKAGKPGSPTWVPSVASVKVDRRGIVIKGDPAEIARQLVEKLKADGAIPGV